MVASALTLLQALNPKAKSADSKDAQPFSNSRHSGAAFARLVEDADSTKNIDAAKPKSRAEIEPRERRVQKHDTRPEHNARPERRDFPTSQKQLEREISPREAGEMLERFDATTAKLGLKEKQPEAVASLKEKLVSVAQGEALTTVGYLLAALSGQDGANLLEQLSRGDASTQGELVSQLKQMMQFIRTALRAVDHSASDSELAALPEPQLEDREPIVLAQEPTELGTLTTVLTPLANEIIVPTEAATSATTVIPATATAIAPEPTAVTTATAAPSEAITGVDLGKRPAIEQFIPSLALTKEEKTITLPDIELPKTFAAKSAPAPAPTNAARDPSALERKLEALNMATAVVAMPVKSEETLVPANSNKPASGIVSAIPAVTLASGGVAPQTASAVTSITSVAQGVVNNAPIREQVSVAISKAAKEGVDQIYIQLDPAGLGRVEVKLQIGQDGQTSIAFLVDKAETFDALSRDARGLERTLQESGLKADSGSMQFNLRQQPQTAFDGNNERGGNGSGNATPAAPPEKHAAAEPAITRQYRVNVHDGIDIHA